MPLTRHNIAGIFLGHLFNNQYLDGVASIAIGLLLMSVAGILASRTQGLLLGEGVNPEELADIRRRVDSDPAVKSAGDILTMYMGPHDLLVNVGVCFAAEITAEQMHEAIHRIQADLQSAYPEINRVYAKPSRCRPRQLNELSRARLITTIKWLALVPFTIMLAEQHYSELFADAALFKHELLEIHRSKISLHHAKTGYDYPTIRLPHTFSRLVGLSAQVYQTVYKGSLAFLTVISPTENASKTSKASVFTRRRSPVRIRPSPSFF